MAKPWWRKRLVRIYHPQAHEHEWRDLDVQRFVADCLLTSTEAVVVSAGGLYALYPTQVPYHTINPNIGDRDLLGEIIREAHAHGLRVIAQVDFSTAREEVWQAHPEWFLRDVEGQPMRIGDHYITCPIAGYQNEDFALAVLREIARSYDVDGFYLSNAGFHGSCFCETCTAAYGEAIPPSVQENPQRWQRFIAWREAAISQQLASYYRAIRRITRGALFAAALAGPSSPTWARQAAQHLPSLSRSFSQLLLNEGSIVAEPASRAWIGVAAEQALAVRRKQPPILGLHMHLSELGLPQVLKSPAEFALYSYQAIAHGAGLQISTCGLPANQLDPRTMPTLAQVFGFMRQQKDVLDSMVPIRNVGLVWPEAALRQMATSSRAHDALRREFLGLYATLRARHVLVGVLYDELIAPKTLKRYSAVVLPTATWLEDRQIDTLISYVGSGGRLVLFDALADPDGPGFRPMPRGLAQLLGGEWSAKAGNSGYALSNGSQAPRTLWQLGPLALTLPYRRFAPNDKAEVWFYSAMPLLEEDQVPASNASRRDPLVIMMPMGEGCVVYAATGWGQPALLLGTHDYGLVLEAMLYHGAPLRPWLITNAPSAVELTMAHWKDGVVVHLVNAAGPVPLDMPAQVGPILLDLAWDGPAVAELCVPGLGPQQLRCEETWNRVKIVVPRLDAYAQVVVRSG